METRAEKLKQAGIKRHGSIEAWRKAMADQGRKGGKATGDSKRRGDKEYYSTIGKRGSEVRYGKTTKV